MTPQDEWTELARQLVSALKYAANTIEAMRPTFSQVKNEGHAFHDQVLDTARIVIAKADAALTAASQPGIGRQADEPNDPTRAEAVDTACNCMQRGHGPEGCGVCNETGRTDYLGRGGAGADYWVLEAPNGSYGFNRSEAACRSDAEIVRGAIVRPVFYHPSLPASPQGHDRHLVEVDFPNGMRLTIVREDEYDAVTIWSEDEESIFTQAEAPRLSAVGIAPPSTEEGGGLRDTLWKALQRYEMTNMGDGDGHGYPLIDLMSNDGTTIDTGRQEMLALADHLCQALARDGGKTA